MIVAPRPDWQEKAMTDWATARQQFSGHENWTFEDEINALIDWSNSKKGSTNERR